MDSTPNSNFLPALWKINLGLLIFFLLPAGMVLSFFGERCWADIAGRKDFLSGPGVCWAASLQGTGLTTGSCSTQGLTASPGTPLPGHILAVCLCWAAYRKQLSPAAQWVHARQIFEDRRPLSPASTVSWGFFHHPGDHSCVLSNKVWISAWGQEAFFAGHSAQGSEMVPCTFCFYILLSPPYPQLRSSQVVQC